MKTLLELLITCNLALFIINCMFAGVSLAQDNTNTATFFALAGLAHALASDYFKSVKQKRYPSETEKS